METWRIIATALLGFSGLFGVLIVVARVREKTRSAATAGVTALVAFTTLAVLAVLTLTVLPGGVTWGIAVAVTAAVGVLLLAS
ncbi:hypothetical protein BAY61_29275 [Prauserella marina]|uniref:Uncharacterized protein n=1 Tax=Prauserella marina TaxID=530584 RepID=A0A222VWX8_9PSEU|nr:hypothetical protein [Prauserella marina]ASR38417.1 hypothetical protein BAY61_29275 [Prauserella marina]PWV78349.1 hypothetical protein DES30_10480 [Prauserella marina]SDC84026.1 hypothetical protein SAMN05421630_10480 [Prauserella marina]